nr:histone H3.v1-like [Aegilops tauschii subsp. strangulata]
MTRGAISMEILLSAMAEAMESPDPRQRARWYKYHSRLSSPTPEAEGLVNSRVIDVVGEERKEEDKDSDNEEEEEDSKEMEEEEDFGEEEDSNEEEEEDSDKEDEQEEDIAEDIYQGFGDHRIGGGCRRGGLSGGYGDHRSSFAGRHESDDSTGRRG